MRQFILSLFLCFACNILSAQLNLSVRIDSALVTTTCTDFFTDPDELFRVSIEGEATETYAPGPGPDVCFTSAPLVQFSRDIMGSCNLPATVEVCFEAFENDGLPFTCQINPDCLESICVDIPVPQAGASQPDTVQLSGGDSEGELFLTISVTEDDMDFNYVCGAVDLGLLDYGTTLGDSTAGIYNNNCADPFNEINPTDINVNVFNNHGVWFHYRTGPTPGPLHIIELKSDPDNTGDVIDTELVAFSGDSCTGQLNRYPLYVEQFGGMNARLNLYCPLPDQDYYILVDGAGNSANQQGIFSFTVYDPGFPAGADLKCDADDLGVVPENGTSAWPDSVGNFCATFAGDPFIRNFISRNSVWFTFRAPSSGHIQVDAVSSTLVPIDLELALYRSGQDTCDSFLSHLYSGRDPSGFDESFTMSCLDPGRQYWILVDGSGQASQGFFTLSVTDLGDIRPVVNQRDTICFGETFPVGPTILHDTTGIYVDTLKIPNTNCDSIVITDLVVIPELQLSVTQTRPAITNVGTDGVATASFSGGTGRYEISWCGGPFVTAPAGSDFEYNQLEAGTNCCVVIKDDFGCEIDTCFQVDFVFPFEPFKDSTSVLCNGDSTGSITFGINGGRAPYGYFWENADQSLTGNGLFLAEGESETINDLPAGVYEVRIGDQFFDSTFQITVTEPDLLVLAIDQTTPISCFRADDGNFVLATNGGTGVYTFDTIAPAAGFGAPGNYVFTVTDQNNCMAQTTATLIEPAEFIVMADEVQQVSCFDGDDGSITLVSNGNPASYAWSHGPVTASVNNLTAGTYTVTITNTDGCPDTISVIIDQPLAPLQVNFTELNPITCADDADGQLRADVSGGEGSLTYLWSNGQTTATADDLGPGNYSVFISDLRGCTVTANYILDAPPPLTATTLARDLRCPDPENAGEISVPITSGGVGPYLYAIDGATFGMDTVFGGLITGAYTVTVQDALGCEYEVQELVNPPPVLSADLGQDREILLGDSLLLNLAVNSTDITYQWSFDGVLQSSNVYVRPASSTRIQVTVTDTISECITSAEVYIMVDGRPRIYVPTAFSPNGDGVNDVFFPFGGTDVSQVSDFRIFGRYGNLVYESPEAFSPNAPSFGWDGLVNGEPAQSGVYVYTSKVLFFDGREEVIKGEITLVR